MAMENQGGGQPILVMPKDTTRVRDRDAQQTNIRAARIISEAIRTTLGPRGMDKMLVDSLGDVVITNDGVTILEEMELEHPAAKNDRGSSEDPRGRSRRRNNHAVVIAGSLLEESKELIDQNIHSSIVASGFKMAADKAKEVIETSLWI